MHTVDFLNHVCVCTLTVTFVSLVHILLYTMRSEASVFVFKHLFIYLFIYLLLTMHALFLSLAVYINAELIALRNTVARGILSKS